MKFIPLTLFRTAIFLLFLTPWVAAQGQCTLSPPLDLGPDTTGCETSPFLLDAGAPYASYSWNSGQTTQTITVDSTGMYVVTVTDTAGCTGSDTVQFTAFPDPVVDLGPDIDTCNTPLVIIDAGIAGGSYVWNDNTTQQTLGITTDGTYYVQVTVNGCSASDTVDVAFHLSDPAFSLGTGPMFCLGFSDTLDGGSQWYSWAWNTGDTSQSIVVTDSGFYQVTVTNQWGCVTNSFPVWVTVWPGPAQPVITGNSLGITTDPATSWQWYLNGSPIVGATSQSYIPTLAGTYTVEVTDANGCVSVLSLPFEVIFEIDETQITQLVSPNGDGVNDYFVIPELINFPINELIIMNRYGMTVYQTENYANTWDGLTNDGKQVPEGTLYYLLDIKNDGKPFTGFFQLIR
ncbi:MAG: gliding motility-associated C-terminal domain-containing protein [Bacteroidia bacterium]|nr:gliding motility-associated C-terminal domain-containing protein [Bacteroidia bacterium]